MARKARIETVPPTSRWFRVTGPQFDWMPTPRSMISFPHGAIGYRPHACIEAGLAAGVIEVIDRPKGYSVDKSGNILIKAPQKIATQVYPDCKDPDGEPWLVHEVISEDGR